MNLQKSIRKVLREYIEEARLSDLIRVVGDKSDLHTYIEKEKSKKFEVDRDLPKELTLKKRYNNKKMSIEIIVGILTPIVIGVSLMVTIKRDRKRTKRGV